MAKIPSDSVDRRLADVRMQHEEHRSSLAKLKIRSATLSERTIELRRDLNLVIRDSQQLVASILRLRARHGGSDWRRMETNHLRIAAVGSVFLQGDISGPDDLIDLGTALRDISHEADSQLGRRSVGLRYDIGPVPVTVRRAQHLALIANELVVNAYEHAFVGRPFGAIEVGARLVQEHRGLMWVLDNGVGCATVLSPSSAGGGWTMINALARNLEAQVTYTDMHPGTRIELAFKVA